MKNNICYIVYRKRVSRISRHYRVGWIMYSYTNIQLPIFVMSLLYFSILLADIFVLENAGTLFNFYVLCRNIPGEKSVMSMT